MVLSRQRFGRFFAIPRGTPSVRAYRIAYDGRPYHGFQRQPDVATVEDTLFEALAALDVVDDGAPPRYGAAGRTDRGVSAVAQTVAFDAPEWLTPAAWNSELPDSVRVWAQATARGDFHATHHAQSREYTYFLYAPHAGERRVRDAMEALAGENDFHNLTPDSTGTRRDLSTSVSRDGEFLVLRFRADGFPRQLVRRAVSLVTAIARETAPLERVERVLGSEPMLGPDGIEPASPEPLIMTDVSYDLTFEGDEDAIESTRTIFSRQYIQQASRARVSKRILEGIHS